MKNGSEINSYSHANDPFAHETQDYEEACEITKADIIHTLKSGKEWKFVFDKSKKSLFEHDRITLKDALALIADDDGMLHTFYTATKSGNAEFRADLQNVVLDEAIEKLAEQYCTEEVQAMQLTF